MIRQPIALLVGHVDHGKSQIVETITGRKIIEKEAGRITQAISAINVPFSDIKNICGSLLESLKYKVKIPGLLFIDSPGHHAFTNLRKRGGNLADIAILVVDINEGIKEQTVECIDILKSYKTPFIVAANKIDLIPGWQSKKGERILDSINLQGENVKEELNKRLYGLVGKLSEYNLNSERFDKVDDYTKQIAIIPISAKNNEGLAELLMVLTGLAQKYLEKKLEIDEKKAARGVVLEVKEEKGIGKILDVIIYDGVLKKNDKIVIGGLDKPIITKVRGLFGREENKLKNINSVTAANGVKIFGSNIDDVISGMPLMVANKDLENIKKQIQKQVNEVVIETDKGGVIVKADSLGSLEALISLLKEGNIEIRKATIGDINKVDVAEAGAEENKLNRVILGFNVKSKFESKEVKLIIHDIIYKIVEDYEKWLEGEKRRLEEENLKGITRPGKIQILPGTVFRQSNPAVVGVEVLQGSIKVGCKLMNKDGRFLTEIKSIQIEGEGKDKVKRGEQAAIALPNVVVGRQINEGNILYVDINEEDFRKLKEMKKYLKDDEIGLLKEIAIIKRKENPVWGF